MKKHFSFQILKIRFTLFLPLSIIIFCLFAFMRILPAFLLPSIIIYQAISFVEKILFSWYDKNQIKACLSKEEIIMHDNIIITKGQYNFKELFLWLHFKKYNITINRQTYPLLSDGKIPINTYYDKPVIYLYTHGNAYFNLRKENAK